MLNPPISLLSDELLDYIVEHVSKLPLKDENLCNLSLTDRAFTWSCQRNLFRNLILGSKREMSKRLKNVKNILDDRPEFANQVRTVQLRISRKENASLFKDPIITSILQLFAKSPMPPYELHFAGRHLYPSIIEDPILIVRHFAQSFFPQTLTVLRLTRYMNVSSSLLLIFPRLREVYLDRVKAADRAYYKYPDSLSSGREFPPLEVLNYCHSHSFVQQMITLTPPTRFNTQMGLWSTLRVLTLTPHEKEGVGCLQPILDAACNTLEELYLTSLNEGQYRHRSLAGLVNLSNLPNLQAFSLYVIINCNEPWSASLHNINIALGTVPKSNKVANLWLILTSLVGAPSLDVLIIGLGCSTKSSAFLLGSLSSWNYKW